MAGMGVESVTIVNRNYPPIAGGTGASAWELAKYLVAEGIQVKVVLVAGTYQGGGAKDKVPVGEMHKVKAIYNGKRTLLRLFSTFVESKLLIERAAAVTDSNSCIIVMTDPPFLNYWAARVLKGRPWALWTMDLYPDAFVSRRLVSKNSFLYRRYKERLVKAPPAAIIALGPAQADYVESFYGRNFDKVVLPSGIRAPSGDADPRTVARGNGKKICFGYCGNLGEAHAVEPLAQVVRNLNPERHVFVLSVYGSRAEEFLTMVSGYDVVRRVDGLSQDEFSEIDIHLVSLLDSWVHVCVPSKAVSAVCSGAAILYFGPSESDTWEMLRNGGWRIPIRDDLEDRVKAFVHNLSESEVLEKKQQSAELATQLNQQKMAAYNEAKRLILEMPA